MATLVLHGKIVDAIKDNQILLAEIAAELNVSVFSMYRILGSNDARLTQSGVLRLLKKRLGFKKDTDLLEELNELIE